MKAQPLRIIFSDPLSLDTIFPSSIRLIMKDCTNTFYDPSSRPHLILEDKKNHVLDSSSAASSSPIKNHNIDSSATISKRRKVRFDCSGVSETSTCDVKEVDKIWYSRQDIQQWHTEVVDIVKKTQKEATGPGKLVVASSFRGIEDLLCKTAYRERRKRKRSVLENVLKEQARQAKLRIVDPDCLGRKSKMASKPSRDLAKKRGSMDAYAAYTLF